MNVLDEVISKYESQVEVLKTKCKQMEAEGQKLQDSLSDRERKVTKLLEENKALKVKAAERPGGSYAQVGDYSDHNLGSSRSETFEHIRKKHNHSVNEATIKQELLA